MAERYIPSEDQYLAAFQSTYKELPPAYQKILNKLYEHCYFMQDNCRLRTWELSEAAGYKGGADGHIGHIGKRFQEFFEIHDDQYEKPSQPALAIVSWFPDDVYGYWYLELILEAAKAFKQFLLENPEGVAEKIA